MSLLKFHFVTSLDMFINVSKFASSGMLIQKKLSDTDFSIPCIRAVILRLLSTGDTIVLSPGWASFDELRNFEHRGKFFQDLAFTCSSG
ncbi:uncharacterized protein LOC126598418 [Malus sylvestris]|uniref:uncharacterized protein LOC126598418 n=1 Tax=Malus sylvestris TaxID=3752 RepID=UPI0021AD0153|nr:uncharacterized protein LOC126598418 [Malus sylvestris]